MTSTVLKIVKNNKTGPQLVFGIDCRAPSVLHHDYFTHIIKYHNTSIHDITEAG